jgi:hypothetical protein
MLLSAFLVSQGTVTSDASLVLSTYALCVVCVMEL